MRCIARVYSSRHRNNVSTLHPPPDAYSSLLLGGRLLGGLDRADSLDAVRDNRTHSREEQHLLDVGTISEEHDQSVNTETPSAGRGQTILERIDECLVDTLGLVVARILLSGLLDESLALVEGVVELGVGVADFLGGDESLESFAETGARSVVFGQGGHDLGVADNEGWVDALGFDKLADELYR